MELFFGGYITQAINLQGDKLAWIFANSFAIFLFRCKTYIIFVLSERNVASQFFALAKVSM